MNDIVVTEKSNTILTFEDNTSVKMTEQSKLVIDDFVYDPNKGSGKLSVKVALGTARYASGQIAKNNPQSVNVKTPTATIAVRGTDFTMTVDELGRSLIILLPSCDDKGCVTGAISVSNDSGTVYLDTAYQATLVTSLNSMPTEPKIINIDPNNINNMLILSPPIKTQDVALQSAKGALDVDYLNRDFLKFTDLDENKLENFKQLDINYLENDFLVNMLDLSMQDLLANQIQLTYEKNLLPNFNVTNNIKYFFNDDQSKITLRRDLNHVAEVTVSVEQNTVVKLNQDGTQVTQKVNSGGSTSITIIQTR